MTRKTLFQFTLTLGLLALLGRDVFAVPAKSADPRARKGASRGETARPRNDKPRLSEGNFDVQKLADGVHAVIRKDPLGLWFESNHVFIINDEDVIVIDADISLESSRQVIAALRKLTDKPVKYVVNTHWHDDHVIGNQVYREAFPGVEFIGHQSTLADFPKVGASNRKQSVEGGPGLVAELKDLVGKNKSFVGGELTDEERAGYAETIRIVERYVAESPGFKTVLPTITIADRLTLHRGNRDIEIRFLGGGHTLADLAVYLPKENILIAGDMVVWPVPLVGSTSFPSAYCGSLEKLLGFNAAIIVPGHGPVLRDDSYVKQMLRLMTSIKDQTAAAVARGETLEQTRKSVNLAEFRKLFAGDSKLRGLIFDYYVKMPGVEAAYREATGKQ